MPLYTKKNFFLEIKEGVVVAKRTIDNTRFYNDKTGMKARNMNDLIEAIFGMCPKKKDGFFHRMIEKFHTFKLL